ncbi:MAG TPA: RNA polymerase sigma factor [Polyangiaceae bacterium]
MAHHRAESAPIFRSQAKPEAALEPRRVRFVDDAALLRGVRAGNPIAMAEFHQRFARRVQRILRGILGPDHELLDLHQDVFVRALKSIATLKEPDALSGWIDAIAVHTARSTLEKRISRRRWLIPSRARSATAHEHEASSPDPAGALDARQALRAVFVVIDQLPVPERVAFGLRFVQGLELSEVAEACQVSLATIKRRLAHAQIRFTRLAQRSPVLAELMKKEEPGWARR